STWYGGHGKRTRRILSSSCVAASCPKKRESSECWHSRITQTWEFTAMRSRSLREAGFQGLYLQTLSKNGFQGLYLQTLSKKSSRLRTSPIILGTLRASTDLASIWNRI